MGFEKMQIKMQILKTIWDNSQKVYTIIPIQLFLVGLISTVEFNTLTVWQRCYFSTLNTRRHPVSNYNLPKQNQAFLKPNQYEYFRVCNLTMEIVLTLWHFGNQGSIIKKQTNRTFIFLSDSCIWSHFYLDEINLNKYSRILAHAWSLICDQLKTINKNEILINYDVWFFCSWHQNENHFRCAHTFV